MSESALKEALDKDPSFQGLQAREAEQIKQLNELKSKLGNENPTVQTAAKVLDSTRKALEARRLELLPQATKEWREKMAVEVRANIDNLKIKMAFSKQLETELEGAVKQYNNIAQKINLGNLNVEMMTDDIAAVERVAKKVADE